MRIISGKLRGKSLKSPINWNTRPTSDKARQGVFNIIEHAPFSDGILNKNILDVFAGTGAFGIEALSRGAAFSGFIENDKNAISVLRENIKACGIEEVSKIYPIDAKKPVNLGQKFDIIFLDPPYNQSLLLPALENIKSANAIAKDALIIAEHHRDELIELGAEFATVRRTNYGINAFILAKFQG